MEAPTLRYAERHDLVGRHDEINVLRDALDTHARSVVVLSGPPGVGKSAIASRLVEMTRAGALVHRFARTISLSLFQESWTQILPRLAEEVLGPALVPKATHDELQELLVTYCQQHPTLVMVDNFDAARDDSTDFLQRWVDTVEESVFMVTAINGLTLSGDRVLALQISGLTGAPEQLDLIGPELRSRFGDETLLPLLADLGGVPLRLLYLRWQNPRDLDALRSTVEGLAENQLDGETSVMQVLTELAISAVPFLALGVVRQLQFPETLLASFWDNMGGGNAAAYIRFRDRLVAARLLSPVPGPTAPAYRVSEEVHTHLLRSVVPALGGEQRLPTLHYFASEYYRRMFEEDRLGSLPALEGYVHHCREEGDPARALAYILTADVLEDLHRAGMALHLQAALESFLDADELTDLTFDHHVDRFIQADWCDDASKCRILLELAHVYSDLSDFRRCLITAHYADRLATRLALGAERDQMHQAVWYYRGVSHSNLGESDECLRAYFRVASGTKPMDRRACLAFGYLAHDLKYRDLDAADRLGAAAVVEARGLGDKQILAKNLCSYAETQMYRCDFTGAKQSLAEATAITDDVGGPSLDQRELGRILMNDGVLCLAMSENLAARDLLERGHRISRTGGDRRRAATADLYLGILAHHQDDFQSRDDLMTRAILSLADQGDGRYLVPAILCDGYWRTGDAGLTRESLAELPLPEEKAAIARHISEDDRFEVFARFWREHFHRVLLARPA